MKMVERCCHKLMEEEWKTGLRKKMLRELHKGKQIPRRVRTILEHGKN
jgi:hypothetical protein